MDLFIVLMRFLVHMLTSSSAVYTTSKLHMWEADVGGVGGVGGWGGGFEGVVCSLLEKIKCNYWLI
jgi:hypothetical protein